MKLQKYHIDGMDLARLMNSLSVNVKEDRSASNFKIFATKVNTIHTDIVFGDFTNQCLLIITQYEKVGNLLKITRDQVNVDPLNTSEPVLSYQEIFGTEGIAQQAAALFIAGKLNISKPLMFFLNLKNYSKQTVCGIAEKLSHLLKETA